MATNDRKSAREFLWKKHGEEALLDTYTGEDLVDFAEAYAAERVSVLERALRTLLHSSTICGAGKERELAEAVLTKGCWYCMIGFPKKKGIHYGTQALGMIPNQPCEAEAALGETERK